MLDVGKTVDKAEWVVVNVKPREGCRVKSFKEKYKEKIVITNPMVDTVSALPSQETMMSSLPPQIRDMGVGPRASVLLTHRQPQLTNTH